MAMITAMSTKGQIVLPKRIRTALNLNAGTQFIVFSDNDNILLKPIREPKRSEFETLLKRVQDWTRESGMSESDIGDAVKAVRRRKRKA